MLNSYFTIARRNLLKNKASSFINIGGLATGMTVALLIGLWCHDELSFNKSFPNYDRIGKVWQFVTFDQSKGKASYEVMPVPLAAELRTKYPEFQSVSLASEDRQLVLGIGDKKITETGNYVEPGFPGMLSLKMISGDRGSLKDLHSILLSRTLARTLFGQKDPEGSVLKIGDTVAVKVAGVYEDFPENSAFKESHFLCAWDLYAATEPFVAQSKTNWDNNSFQIYAQLKSGADFGVVSAKIKDSRMKQQNPPAYHPEFFLFPMSRWHLYHDFQNGVNTGGTITFVWLFGIIGIFVLLLACINFMNLSTARSERRAKEVGIRKAIGSLRSDLIWQFLTESILVAMIAFGISLLLAGLVLPFFNGLSGKELDIPWTSPFFWLLGLGFSLLTGLIAGSYPALYLSSFQPVRVLKGTFKAGRLAAIPRKVLVVLQFTVSVTLIIGTIIVFRQIQYAKARAVGYSRGGLIELNINTPQLGAHFDALRTALLHSGAVAEAAESSCEITGQNGGTTAFAWHGEDPNQHPLFMSNQVTPEFGKTVGWQVSEGRDFSRAYGSDSTAIILNEAAVKFIGFKKPIGEEVGWGNNSYRVIGVVRDMVRESPFEPVKPSFFVLGKSLSVIQVKLSPQLATSDALGRVAGVLKVYNPSNPFTYNFVDDAFNQKFGNEEFIRKLATFFAALAIFISCLGLYGLVSFVAEQRTREIGVRKVLGASLFNVWGLLSKEFMVLVTLSLLISIPVAYHFMHNWLKNYDYRAPLSWWIFGAAAFGALAVTLATVSVEAIKAALANPVKSLRSE
jgi:putative ABC transport system permease protein